MCSTAEGCSVFAADDRVRTLEMAPGARTTSETAPAAVTGQAPSRASFPIAHYLEGFRCPAARRVV